MRTNKKEKGFGILEIMMLVMVVGLVAVIGWLVLTRQDDAKSSQNDSQAATKTATQNKEQPLHPEDITAKIKNSYASKYTLVNSNENNKPQSGEMAINLAEHAPAYKTKGYDFYTDYDGGSSIFLIAGPVNWETDPQPRPIDVTIRTEVASIYKDFGLVKTGTVGRENESSERDVYTGEGLICTIETPESATSSTSANCGRIDEYKEAAKKAEPFVKLLPKTNPSTILHDLKITDSPVSGYQKASAGVGSMDYPGGVIALFYKTSPESQWKYFQQAQQSLSCSAYDTTDLRNAFKGDRCYGASNAEMTVQ